VHLARVFPHLFERNPLGAHKLQLAAIRYVVCKKPATSYTFNNMKAGQRALPRNEERQTVHVLIPITILLHFVQM
jgi:hypothetical protein